MLAGFNVICGGSDQVGSAATRYAGQPWRTRVKISPPSEIMRRFFQASWRAAACSRAFCKVAWSWSFTSFFAFLTSAQTMDVSAAALFGLFRTIVNSATRVGISGLVSTKSGLELNKFGVVWAKLGRGSGVEA